MQFGVGDAGKTGSRFVSLFMVLVSLGFLCSCRAPHGMDSSGASLKSAHHDPFMPPISEARALSVLQQHYQVSPDDVELRRQTRLLFSHDQVNEVLCIDYIDRRFDRGHFIDCFVIRPGGDPELMMRQFTFIGTDSGHDFRVLDFDGKRYAVLWDTQGSAHFVSADVYEYRPMGAMQAVWSSETGGGMGGRGMISEGVFFIDYGGGEYEKLVREDGEFRMVDASLRYDYESAPWLSFLDDQWETLEVDTSTDPYQFQSSNARLTMTETPGEQDDSRVAWKHYTVEDLRLKVGQLLLVLPADGKDVSGFRTCNYDLDLLERKPGSPRRFLAKKPGTATLVVEEYQTVTYRFEIEILGEDAEDGETDTTTEADHVEASAPNAPPAPEKAEPEEPGPPVTLDHAISRGETLESIATTYDCTVEDLKKVNPEIQSDADLQAGETMKIPF